MKINDPFLLSQILRIVAAIICYNQAKWLNRDAGFWAVLGFFFPVISTILIFFLKAIPIKVKTLNVALRPVTKYYTDSGIIEVENIGERRVSINGKTATDGKYVLNKFESIEVLNGTISSNN